MLSKKILIGIVYISFLIVSQLLLNFNYSMLNNISILVIRLLQNVICIAIRKDCGL